MEPETKTAWSTSVIEGETVYKIPIRVIRAFSIQPRKYFDPATMQGLADSIRSIGQQQAGSVIPLDPPIGEYLYELVDGERRIRACLMAGVDFFKTKIDTEIKNQDEQFEKSVTANFHHQNHPPIEVANAIDRFKKMGKTIEQIRIIMGGRSPAWITQHHRLLKLEPEVLKTLDPGLPEEQQLTFSVACALVDLSGSYQIEVTKRIITRGLGMKEAMHLINKTLHDTGAGGKRKSGKEFANMLAFFRRTATQVDLLLDISDAQLLAILKRKDLQTRMELPEKVEKLAKKISAFQEKVGKILTEI